MKLKFLATPKGRKRTRIICAAVAAVCLAVMIAGNVILTTYSKVINSFLAGGGTSGQSGEILQDADLVAREAAEESMVLLKNEEDFLPIADLKKVNLFGWGSHDKGSLLAGGGSGGRVITDEKGIKVDLNDALKEEKIEYNETLYKKYGDLYNMDADNPGGATTGADVNNSLLNPDASFYTDELMNSAKAYSPVAIAVLSRWGAENGGFAELLNPANKNIYKDGTFLELTDQERAMFDALQKHNFNVVVVLNTCNYIELGFLEEYSCIKSCIYAGIPGQSGFTALPRILTGKTNPSGRLNDTLAYDFQTNNPTFYNAARSGDNIVYQEGIYFGYKWYETADAEGVFDAVTRGGKTGYDAVVQYPFGYGMSYTKFEWNATFPKENTITKDGKYEIEVSVKNVGNKAGKDVVQLYGHVDYTNGGIERAERVLIDFAKTPLIAPGHTEKVKVKFSAYDLASYDAYDKNKNNEKTYELDKGGMNVELSLRSDAHNIKYKNNNGQDKLSKKFSVQQTIVFKQDPDTEKDVKNRFTGNDAYAGCPLDGSKAYTGGNAVEYLSRANHFANYDKLKACGTPNNVSVINNAKNYYYQGYNGANVSDIKYGQESGLYLVQVEVENADGTKTYKKANEEQLSGKATDVKLVINKDVMEILCDYESIVWDILLSQMSETDVKMLIASGGFETVALESIGKTRARDSDGPAGFNDNVNAPGKSSEFTLFPAETLLGCSWSTEVNAKIGDVQGRIAQSEGINGWYGPGVNLHRSMYDSRNYEYYSEDGVLSGKLAEATIAAAREQNLYCYLKHMALSEAGQNPTSLNVWTTEQALRENYLKPFEIAVKGGSCNAIMSAFNNVGPVCAGYNQAMLTGILRDEWQFKGSVITDYFLGSGYMNDFTRGVLAGNNLWLQGATAKMPNLDLSRPEVAYAARLSAKNILYTYVSTLATQGDIKVNAAPSSPLFTALLVVANVLLAGGIIACGTFFALSFIKGGKGEEVAQTEGEGEEYLQQDEIFEATEGAGEQPESIDGSAGEQPESAPEVETIDTDGGQTPSEDSNEEI